MGRSSYTANTVTYLAHAASSSSSCSSRSTSHAEGADMHNKSTSSTIASSNLPTTSSSSRVKDTPTTWAVNAFDPDDETLPSIDERFLEPYEDVDGIHFLTGQSHQEDRDLTSDDDDDDEESRWDDEEEAGEETYEFDEQVYDTDGNIVQLPPLDAFREQLQALRTRRQHIALSRNPDNEGESTAVVELATALLQQQQQPPRYDGTSRPYVQGLEYSYPDPAQEQEVEHAEYAYEGRDAIGNDIDEEDDYEPPHGNGGYYDFGYSREDEEGEQVTIETRRNTTPPSIVDDFSPSAGVFHRHTLPFNLPDMGEVQLQRRTSGNSSSNNFANSNASVTVSSAVY